METKHTINFEMHFPKKKMLADEANGDGENIDAEKYWSCVENLKSYGIQCGRAEEYQVIKVIGKGSYGKVYRAKEKKTNEIVAMKRELDGLSRSSLREIDILQSLVGRPWFVGLREVVADKGGHLYLVMENLEMDLKGYTEGITWALTEREVKYFMRQLLEGVAFLHQNRIMHRDLKPSNILLGINGEFKICDFGLSKRFVKKFDRHSHCVGSLWYKAPELLTKVETYSCAIDMWSVGCIMGEMLLNQVLLEGWSQDEQLQKITEALTKPFFDEKFSTIISPRGLDLLKGFFAPNPDSRITAEEALDHAWFTEI